MSATKVVRTEKTVRGPFGQLVKWTFIIFNLVMLCLMVAFCGHVGNVVNQSDGSDAAVAGAGIGGALGGGFIFVIWVGGAVILGLVTMMTKGKKIIVEETIS